MFNCVIFNFRFFTVGIVFFRIKVVINIFICCYSVWISSIVLVFVVGSRAKCTFSISEFRSLFLLCKKLFLFILIILVTSQVWCMTSFYSSTRKFHVLLNFTKLILLHKISIIFFIHVRTYFIGFNIVNITKISFFQLQLSKYLNLIVQK